MPHGYKQKYDGPYWFVSAIVPVRWDPSAIIGALDDPPCASSIERIKMYGTTSLPGITSTVLALQRGFVDDHLNTPFCDNITESDETLRRLNHPNFTELSSCSCSVGENGRGLEFTVSGRCPSQT